MMKKQFKSKSVEKVGETPTPVVPVSPEKPPEGVHDTPFILPQITEPKEEFPVGTKFELNNLPWMVTRAWIDTSTHWRHLAGPMGQDQVVTLNTLKKDMVTPTFKFVEPTLTELLFMLGHGKVN